MIENEIPGSLNVESPTEVDQELSIGQEVQEAILTQLLAPLSSNEGVGDSVRYDHIFDQIREARREEDSNLSQGVWKIETKKAEWDVVENLSVKVLTERSKDLQVAIWLAEAWIIKHGLNGLRMGMELINGLSTTFWDHIYPQIDGDDMEYRIHIFEWFDKEIASRCLLLPVARSIVDVGGSSLTLADWIGAVDLDRISKRSQDPKSIINKALSRGKVDLNGFRKILTTTSIDFLTDLKACSEQCLEKLADLQRFLEEKISKSPPSLVHIRQTLTDLVRLCDTGIQQSQIKNLPKKSNVQDLAGDIESLMGDDADQQQAKQQNLPNNSEDGPVVISERQHAYQALRDISRFLSALEPHSPVPQLLHVIGGWEDKSITEVLSDIRSQPVELHLLLRLLADAANNVSQKN